MDNNNNLFSSFMFFFPLTALICLSLVPSIQGLECWFDPQSFVEMGKQPSKHLCANAGDECVYIKCYADADRQNVFRQLIDCAAPVDCTDFEKICGNKNNTIPDKFQDPNSEMEEPYFDCKSCREDLCNDLGEEKNGSGKMAVGNFIPIMAFFAIQAAIVLAFWNMFG